VTGAGWPPPGQQPYQPPPPYQPGYGAPGYGAPPPTAEPLPGIALTIVITALFALFGLIPAALAAGKARRMGQPETRYWVAFGATLVGSVVLYGLVLALILISLRTSDTIDAGHAAAPPAAQAPAPDATDATCEFTPDVSGNPNLVDVGMPPADVPTSGTAELTLGTNFGDIVLVLDRGGAPCAAASFVHLAEQGFFDGTNCHRQTDAPGFQVLQCGDPTGTGAGGPSYEFPTQVTGQETYPRGTIAMANAGQGFDGSQFFLCFGDTEISPDYTVVGRVDDGGLQVLDQIAANGNDGSLEPSPGGGAPNEPVIIITATVTG
jgi:peptidyl-prolyl cis-trans isomerase B (cyclophilin B)